MKKKSKSKLIKELDVVFSKYIRSRDGNKCITCGRIGEYNTMQAGHYVSRSCYALRWDEMNVHCQCYACNVCKHGNMIAYREQLVKLYGEKKVKKLEVQRHSIKKYTSEELEKMIEYYKKMLTIYFNDV